ncbi:hypothetical protein [Lentilactobacillus sp. Marseille-Q4993]|uniref:hypothetical protein n=1 Tax=Lentilactobacillus sp. Marseille-Q4993 TaxID=3039492 RepID=UPI0024BC22BF|nr:hypothetical protein [Lentilactobacillus sp. Marseille-Q4993]
MQIKQSYISEITNSVKENYHRIINSLPVSSRKTQMPAFQITYFLSQAISNDMKVAIFFNNDDSNGIIGKIKQLDDDRYLISSPAGNLFKIFYNDEVHSIQKVK